MRDIWDKSFKLSCAIALRGVIYLLFKKYVLRRPGEEISKPFELLGGKIDRSGIFAASPKIESTMQNIDCFVGDPRLPISFQRQLQWIGCHWGRVVLSGIEACRSQTLQELQAHPQRRLL